jgi:hypothetical protein
MHEAPMVERGEAKFSLPDATAADEPHTDGTAGDRMGGCSPHANTALGTAHAGTAVFAHSHDAAVRLMDRREGRGLRRRGQGHGERKNTKGVPDHDASPTLR